MPLSVAKTQAGIQIDSVRVNLSGPTNTSGNLVISNDSTVASGSFNNLVAGEYSISILAFANHDTVATGSGNATVIPGQITNATITLTLLTGGLNINVNWSIPQTIVYVKDVAGIQQICTINTDSTNFTILTSFSSNPSTIGKPAYSPDGNKIAFYLNDGSGINIWVMNSNGSNLTQVTFNNESFIGERPEFSSTSDVLYYRRTTGAGAASIWRVDINGQNDSLYNDFSGNEYMIEFIGNSYLMFFVHGGGIYRTNSLIDLASTLLISGAQYPAVNHDLTKLAYAGSGFNSIWISNLDGTSPLLLKDEGVFSGSVSFTKDGQYVVYSRNGATIKIVKIDGSAEKIITDGWDPMAKPN